MEPELVEYLDRKFSHLEGEIRKNREAIHENREAIHENREAIQKNSEAIHENREAIQKNSERIRHTNILVEDLRGQIQLVAEGVTAVRERLDQDRIENEREHRELKNFMKVCYADLDRRVKVLERR